MSRWTLPDGTNVSELPPSACRDVNLVDVLHPQLGQIRVPKRILTAVTPPLPLLPEPHSGGAAASEYTVWLRSMYGWFDGFKSGDDEPCDPLTWEELNERHPELRVLIHDPTHWASELPWTSPADDKGATVMIHSGYVGDHRAIVFASGGGVKLTRTTMRELAATLWRAAAEQEASKS